MGRLYRRPCIRTKRGGMNMNENAIDRAIMEICKCQESDMLHLFEHNQTDIAWRMLFFMEE